MSELGEVREDIGGLKSDVRTLFRKFEEHERLQAQRDEKLFARLDEIEQIHRSAKWLGRGVGIGALFAGGFSGGALLDAISKLFGGVK